MLLEDIIRGIIIFSSLIIAIGAQNLFVLKQGLRKNHIFWVASICFLCDIVLMSVGVFGIGVAINQHVLATIILAFCGGVFLLWYGFNSFKSAYNSTSFIEFSDSDRQENNKLSKAIIGTLAITLLNPHVYLDTVVIIGGIAGTLSHQQKLAFLIGALIASFSWFFGIGYGARLLIPLFKSKKMWFILDITVGCVMFFIAYELILYGIMRILNS